MIAFFLLPGFVIKYSQHYDHDKSFNIYFIKRFTRIYIVLIPMLLLAGAILRPNLADLEFWKILGGNLLMLQDFESGKPNVIVPTLFASALWSLHYEWWFYMVYHPLATRVAKGKQSFLVAAIAIIAAILYTGKPLPLTGLLMYFLIWWAGVDLARSYIANGKVLLRDILPTMLSISVVGAILLGEVLSHYRLSGGTIRPGIHPILELRHFAAAFATLIAALAWQKARWFGFSLLKPGLLIAPISHSLYIAHQPFLADATYPRGIHNIVIQYSLYLAVLLGFCWFTEIKLYPAARNRINAKISRPRLDKAN
ncbi:MAG: acyltransferase family protein [Cyanobium sp.]